MSLRTLARCLTVVTMLLCAAPMVQVAQAADKSRMAVTLAQQASKSFETGDFARASELYLAAWRTDPNPDFLFGAARSAHLGGITDKATELYRQFLGTEGADGERKRRAGAARPPTRYIWTQNFGRDTIMAATPMKLS